MKKSLPIYRQSERAECGLACLAMLISYYGHNIDLIEIRSRYRLSSNGLTLEQLIEIASDFSVTTRPLRLEINDISELRLPCIIHWDLNHFVVLKSFSNSGLIIHDPSCGVKNISLNEFSKHFTGVALEAFPTNSFTEKKAKPKFSITQLWSEIVGIKRVISKIFLLSIFAQLFTLIAPYYMQSVIDSVIPTFDTSLLLVLALAFVFILVFQQITNVLRAYVILFLGTNINIQITNNLFSHMMKLPINFFEKRDVGDIVTRFESLNRIKEFFTNSFVETIIDGLMAVSLLIVLLIYDINVTLTILLFTSIYTVFRIYAYREFRMLNEQEITARAKERSNFIENVHNIRSTMVIDAQAKRVADWSNLNSDSVNARVHVSKTGIFYQTVNSLIFGLENVLVIFLLATAVLNDSITIGMLTAFVAYKRIFTQRISSFIDKLLEFKMLSLHLERVSEIALHEPVEDEPAAGMRKDVVEKIEFCAVSYKYDAFSSNIINNISFTIEKGDYLAVCGPSGVGKSTLVKLLIGLIEPTSGVILVDGLSLRQYGKKRYRKFISTVLQEDKLYSGSLLENITYFDSNPDQEWAEECCNLAQIHKTIMNKPMGYNTLVGQLGDSLSGGEKQRVILARALYRRPQILILDEATSNLDVKTEAFIGDLLSKLDITRIVITHRPQAIRSADKMVRLTRKGIIELDKNLVVGNSS